MRFRSICILIIMSVKWIVYGIFVLLFKASILTEATSTDEETKTCEVESDQYNRAIIDIKNVFNDVKTELCTEATRRQKRDLHNSLPHEHLMKVLTKVYQHNEEENKEIKKLVSLDQAANEIGFDIRQNNLNLDRLVFTEDNSVNVKRDIINSINRRETGYPQEYLIQETYPDESTAQNQSETGKNVERITLSQNSVTPAQYQENISIDIPMNQVSLDTTGAPTTLEDYENVPAPEPGQIMESVTPDPFHCEKNQNSSGLQYSQEAIPIQGENSSTAYYVQQEVPSQIQYTEVPAGIQYQQPATPVPFCTGLIGNPNQLQCPVHTAIPSTFELRPMRVDLQTILGIIKLNPEGYSSEKIEESTSTDVVFDGSQPRVVAHHSTVRTYVKPHHHHDIPDQYKYYFCL